MESMAFKRRIPPSPVYSMPLHFSNGKAGTAFPIGNISETCQMKSEDDACRRASLPEERSADLRQDRRTKFLQSSLGSCKNAQFGALRVHFYGVNRGGPSPAFPFIKRDGICSYVFPFAQITNSGERSPARF